MANKVSDRLESYEPSPVNKSALAIPKVIDNGFSARSPRASVVTIGATSSIGGGKLDTGSIMTGRSSLSRIKGMARCCYDDPRTTKGRRSQLTKILGMAAIPIVILVVQSVLSLNSAIQQQNFASDFRDQVVFAVQAGDVVHALGLERGTTTFYVSMMDQTLLPAAKTR
jgi:hypothetical protein